MSPVTMLTTKVRNADRLIGAILVDAGRISPNDVERILHYQRKAELRFGEAGIALGVLTEGDLLYALSLQFDYPYLEIGGSQPISTEVVAAYRPFSADGERLRALRSQLQLRWFDESSRQTAIAITSAHRGEGRSRLAANLAVTFAQLGQRTLLIDGDLRSPTTRSACQTCSRGGCRTKSSPSCMAFRAWRCFPRGRRRRIRPSC
jgi:protein-tyrosine kinase